MPENVQTKRKANPSTNVRSNVIINLIRTLTMTILSFITFPYVTRALGDQVFGLYTWANTFVYYFLILAKISIPNIAIRECVRLKDDKEKFDNAVQTFFILQAVMTLLSFGLMCAFIFSVPSLYANSEIIFLLSVNFLIGVFSFEWVYIALEKHFYITVRSILLIAFSATLTFLAIRKSEHPENYLYIYALIAISSTILTSIANCIYLPKFVSFKKTLPYRFKPLFKPLFTLFLISGALTLYNQTDEFILGFLDEDKSSVGAYSVGVKGVDIVITLITSLYAVFMPRAAYYYAKENKAFYQNLINYSLNITFFIAIPAIATMATLSNEITNLISGSDASSYQDAATVLWILSAMMLTYSIGDNIYTEILIPMKKEKIYLYTMLLGVALNIGLSFFLALVPFKDNPAIGVAIATGATDVLILGYLLFATRQYARKAVFNLNNLKIVIMGIVIGFFSYFIRPYIEGAMPFAEQWEVFLTGMLSIVAIDAVVYIAGCLLLKEKLVSSFLPGRHKKEKENA